MLRLATTALALFLTALFPQHASAGDTDPEMQVRPKGVKAPAAKPQPPPAVKRQKPPAAAVQKKKPPPQVQKKKIVRKKAPPAPPPAKPAWAVAPEPGGRIVASNGEGFSFTYDDMGQPLLLLSPTAEIPANLYGTETPVSISVDKKLFAILTAKLAPEGLHVSGSRIADLERVLKPASDVAVLSAFASRSASLKGFTAAIDKLGAMRQQW